MAAHKGRSVSLSWNGADISGVREKGISLNGEPIDITSGENDGKRTLLTESGEDQVDISLSGVIKSTILRDAWFSGNRMGTVEIEYPDGTTITGSFFLSAYNEGNPYKDASTFDATLMSSGLITYSPYA
jgi:predicted secreted protein